MKDVGGNTISRDWEKAFEELQKARNNAKNEADRALIEKVLGSLANLKLSVDKDANKYELSILSKVTSAVSQSKTAQDAVFKIDKILSENLLNAGAEVRALHETTSAIIEKERQIKYYQGQLSQIQQQQKGKRKANVIIVIAILIVALVAWILQLMAG